MRVTKMCVEDEKVEIRLRENSKKSAFHVEYLFAFLSISFF